MTSMSDYVALIDSFVAGEIEAKDFESSFLGMFKAQEDPLPEEQFLVLDGLFADVDAFCPDPDLRDPDDLDEQQLRDRSRTALRRLISLLGQ